MIVYVNYTTLWVSSNMQEVFPINNFENFQDSADCVKYKGDNWQNYKNSGSTMISQDKFPTLCLRPNNEDMIMSAHIKIHVSSVDY